MRQKNNTAIIVFGNLASGKTSVCQALKKLMPAFSIISSDNFRLQFENEFNFQKEALTRTLVETELMNAGNVIWETTLSGRFSQSLASKVGQTHKVIKCLIDCPPGTCVKRFHSRPLPSSNVRKEVSETIYHIDEVLQSVKSDIYFDSTKHAPPVIAQMIKNYYDAISTWN